MAKASVQDKGFRAWFSRRSETVDLLLRLLSHLPQQRRRSLWRLLPFSVLPGLLDLALVGTSERGPVVVAELSASPRVVRPAELLTSLAPGAELGVARRRHQWIDIDGARREPMPPSTSMSNPAVAGI